MTDMMHCDSSTGDDCVHSNADVAIFVAHTSSYFYTLLIAGLSVHSLHVAERHRTNFSSVSSRGTS